jgi:hypothetical protein
MKFSVNQKDKTNIGRNNFSFFWKAMPRIFLQVRGKMRHNLSPFGQLGKTKRKRRPARKKKRKETLGRGRGTTFQLVSNLAFTYKNQENVQYLALISGDSSFLVKKSVQNVTGG